MTANCQFLSRINYRKCALMVAEEHEVDLDIDLSGC